MNKFAFLTELTKAAQEIENAGYLKVALALDKLAAEADENWEFTSEDLENSLKESEDEFELSDLEDSDSDEIQMDEESVKVTPATKMSRADFDGILRDAVIRMEKANKKRFGPNAFFFSYPALDTGPVKSSEIEDAVFNMTGAIPVANGENWRKIIDQVSQFEDDLNKALADPAYLKSMDVLKFVKNNRSFKDRLSIQSPWATEQKIKPGFRGEL